jgi:CheY-like chemotaxis protein
MQEDFISYNDDQKHTILVCEDSIVIQKILDKILEFNNYRKLFAANGSIALDIIKNQKIDMLITDINMPIMDGFELVKEVKKLGFDFPIIMMTDKNIDEYLKIALECDVGNILSKPLKKDEVLSLIYKLLTGIGLFGLENYLYFGIEELKTIKIKSSKEIEDAINEILESALKYGLPEKMKMSFKLILIELISNAVYHSHGRTDLKMQRAAFDIPDEKFVEIKHGYDGYRYGVSITDFMGTLTKKRIIETLIDLNERDKKIRDAMAKGEDISPYLKDSGRGLHITREMSPEYYFNIKKGEKTEVIILMDFEKKGKYTSQPIKINEV